MKARPVLIVWLLLMLLLGVELLAAWMPGGSFLAPFVGIGMAILVAMTFMGLPGTPGVGAIFAVAGIFWLCVLMGLGSLDSATRHDVPVSVRTEP